MSEYDILDGVFLNKLGKEPDKGNFVAVVRLSDRSRECVHSFEVEVNEDYSVHMMEIMIRTLFRLVK